MKGTAKTAFMLLVHNHPEQLNKFLMQLVEEEAADVFIHIDAKSDPSMRERIIRHPHITILEERVAVSWGDISQVDATLLLLEAVCNSDVHYDFVCLRSGQDLLVRNGFKQFLAEHRNSLFLAYRTLQEKDFGMVKIQWPKIVRNRYANYHPLRLLRRLLLLLYKRGVHILPNRRYFPEHFTLYKGSQWFTIPFEAAVFIIDFLNKNRWYYPFFEHSLVPDESFFHTLLLNSTYKEKVINTNLYFLKWGESLKERNSPQCLHIGDRALIENSNMFFARKFNEQFDKEVVEYFKARVKLDRANELVAHKY
ncbi:beta-1,6-N-acetylglucosaminyltransferase [Robertmurraya siralis]|uniref:beta-1,6-N-acetylglucosaminyltransferase n=1 Tax=Robertmurraya siralis TaxID=77777 RepID=UPI0010F7E8AB|nr:beta-1,6-N-acetylglucosaminyltransferase [Robertmurraya siralis]